MTSSEKALMKSLRRRGLRKRAARDVVRAANGEAKPEVGHGVVADLSSVVVEVRDRLRQRPLPSSHRDTRRRGAATRSTGDAVGRHELADPFRSATSPTTTLG
jgi:hypothetical protein